MTYKGWTNKKTFCMARTIENNEAHLNEAFSIISKFNRADFMTLVLRIQFRDLKLDSVYIDQDENINWEEITEHLKGKV